jgi:hypothetical protein
VIRLDSGRPVQGTTLEKAAIERQARIDLRGELIEEPELPLDAGASSAEIRRAKLRPSPPRRSGAVEMHIPHLVAHGRAPLRSRDVAGLELTGQPLHLASRGFHPPLERASDLLSTEEAPVRRNVPSGGLIPSEGAAGGLTGWHRVTTCGAV